MLPSRTGMVCLWWTGTRVQRAATAAASNGHGWLRLDYRGVQTVPSEAPPGHRENAAPQHQPTKKKNERVIGGIIGEAERHGATADLRKAVLGLYRDFLRAARNDADLANAARAEFRRHQSVAPSNIQKVDFLLRQGHKKLALVTTPGFKGVSTASAR